MAYTNCGTVKNLSENPTLNASRHYCFKVGHTARGCLQSGNFLTQSHTIEASASYHGNCNQPTSARICLRIVPLRVHDNDSGRMLLTYALLDNGSDVSLCDAELVKELDLQGEQRDFLLTTQEKKDSAKSGLELKLTLSSLDGTSAVEIPRV